MNLSQYVEKEPQLFIMKITLNLKETFIDLTRHPLEEESVHLLFAIRIISTWKAILIGQISITQD
jgi:hypothetical protein